MALKHRTFSNDLKAKDLCYSDDFFSLKGEKIIPADSFSFNNYQALKDVNDFKTNNYSNLFLTKKQANSNWLKADVKEEDELNGLATTISWFTYNSNNKEELGSWLYFSKNYEMFDINVNSVECQILYGKNSQASNFIFYLEFLDDNTCRISHTFGDLVFYLVVEDDKTIHFSKNIDGQKQIFVYNLDDNILKLYKKLNHKKYNVIDQVIGSYNKLYLLGINRDLYTKQATLVLYQNLDDVSSQTMIYINNNNLIFDYYLDGSWVSYNRNKYISSIDRNKSAFGLKTQALLHHEYNKEDGINFIPLKNNLTYKGNSIRGNYMNESVINYPDVDYRTYNSIHSGIAQEKGNDTIILSYTFTDQQYEVEQGDDLFFTIAQKSVQGTNMMQPLWPYKYINLNDTKFIKNGAFGSNVPFFADKVKKLQNHNTNIYTKSGEALQPNNEVYLCSWLYKANHESQPMWLDRYYYPDMISRKDALMSSYDTYKMSFQNIIDKNYNKDDVRNKIHKHTYFDKKSDLMISAGNSYRYQRISKAAIDQVNEKLDEYAIKTVTNESKKKVPLEDTIQFNNETYRLINYKDIKGTNKLNFNADFYLQGDKRMGVQIFGTDYNNGFNIQNRKDVAPFHYYATNEILYLCNNKFQVVHQFDLYQKYEDYILKLFLGDVFDDVIILSGTWMYILSYDLRLKSRIDLTAVEQENHSIKNLGSLVLNEFDTYQKLINYPYGDCEKIVQGQMITTDEIQETNADLFFGSIELNEKIISIDSVLIDYDTVTSGSVKIPSNLCQLMCRQTPRLYKNNLYIPIKQNILKIIMCPNCEEDNKIFTDVDRQEFPAAARILKSDEYYLNYNKTNNTEEDSERLGTEQGFIEVQNIIKHIYFDEDGVLYGLNFDQYGISSDGDTIYGLYSWDKYVKSGGWWWLFNQSLSKMKSELTTAKYAQFASPNSIDRVRINEKGEMCLIRNFNNLLTNTNPDNNKRLEIYDKTKAKIYEFDLSSYNKVITLDAYNFINEAHEEETCFCSICQAYGVYYKVMYLSNAKKMEIKQIQINGQICESFAEIINSNSLMRQKDYNVLYFNLHVPSNFIYDNIATIKWVLDDIQTGWYNINVNVDLDKAIFQVRINDQLHERITEDTHYWFRPYQNSDGTMFTTNYFVGTMAKKYGTTLNKLLKNSPYDPYTCKNLMIDKMIIHTKSLQYYEYLAMRLRNTYVNKLLLTLPCGMRNNIDELIRYFRYNIAPAISNKVKINISGTGLSTQGQFEMLRKEILEALKNNTDCLMTVKDIQFIQNE